jgi:microcystin-dependent protein
MSDPSFSSIERTGGTKTHTLTINEMPNHSHRLPHLSLNSSLLWGYEAGPGTSGYTESIESTGEGRPHNNLQPYITCYMWKRTQ